MTPTANCLSEADVRRLLDPKRLIAALENAFCHRYPRITVPLRTQAQLGNGIFLIMSCYDASGPALGMKLVLVRDHSPDSSGQDALSGGRVQATYLLLDPETAAPRLTIAANYLTDVRTAATSAVATKFLARDDVSTLGIFGTGRLARSHFRLLPLVRNFERVLICDRKPERASEFVREVSEGASGLLVESVDARICAAESDVICTCTASVTPLFEGEHLRAGTHLNLVGAFQPHTREVDTRTIQRSRVFVETYGAVKAEIGELVIPLKEGAIPSDHIAGDLHELVSGKKPLRRAGDEITTFKSVGCALEDLVAAELLLGK